jgi:hypothetical protein
MMELSRARSVCKRLKKSKGKVWPGTESNCRHEDFQSSALPTELPGQVVWKLKYCLKVRASQDWGTILDEFSSLSFDEIYNSAFELYSV